MNTLDIQRALQQLDVRYAGVYPADRLPKVWTRSTAIVANTDNHDRPGQHWVAFYIDQDGSGTYFDSYGIPPSDPRFFLRLRRNSVIYRWNTVRLQGQLSATCGHYCCVFLYFMLRGYSIDRFINRLFTSNYDRNDEIIVKLFNKIFCKSKRERVKRDVLDILMQSCTRCGLCQKYKI